MCTCHYCHYHCCCHCHSCHCITTTVHAMCMPLGPLPLGPLPGLVHRANHRTVTDSGCLCVEPHPFRSKDHTTASGAPDEHILATAVPGSSDPRPPEVREPCQPFGRLAMPDRMDQCCWCPSAAARVGDTSGKSEGLGNKRGAAGWLAVDRPDGYLLDRLAKSAAGLRLVLLALISVEQRALGQ